MRLEKAEIIKRSADGWFLLDDTMAPLLSRDYAWGLPKAFAKVELAARRREAIIHLLRLIPGGLQQKQIADHLALCDWLGTPVSADVIPADLETLDEKGRVKMTGHSKKWVLAEAPMSD